VTWRRVAADLLSLSCNSSACSLAISLTRSSWSESESTLFLVLTLGLSVGLWLTCSSGAELWRRLDCWVGSFELVGCTSVISFGADTDGLLVVSEFSTLAQSDATFLKVILT
jgi:hypothetical protein